LKQVVEGQKYALKGRLTLENRGEYVCHGEEEKKQYFLEKTYLDVIGEKLSYNLLLIA